MRTIISPRNTLYVVIPAKAGIHVATVKIKMDPRFRGDDGGNELATWKLKAPR
jgi:hypothetical protein